MKEEILKINEEHFKIPLTVLYCSKATSVKVNLSESTFYRSKVMACYKFYKPII